MSRNQKKSCVPPYLKGPFFRSRGFPAGFTIIEMVMVIVIVGILALLAIPRFSSFYSIKLTGAAKKLVSDIRYVQQLAISEHTNTKIVFNAVTNTYTAQKYNSTTGTWVAISDPFSRGNLTQNFNSDPQYGGIDIFVTTLSSSTLRYTWQGIPQEGTDAAPVNLAVERSVTLTFRGNTIAVYITPQTGRVRM